MAVANQPKQETTVITSSNRITDYKKVVKDMRTIAKHYGRQL
ncbi:MAG: hypothetical protein ACFFCX_03915 [Candidatus Sifarchaeia archaeon]